VAGVGLWALVLIDGALIDGFCLCVFSVTVCSIITKGDKTPVSIFGRLALIARIAFSAAVLIALPSAANAADRVDGRWVTQDKDAVVTIDKCGAKTCGRITKFLIPPPDGEGQRDIYNPDPELKKRRLKGLAVLSSFVEDGNQWRGRIYDPKTGKSYRSILRRKGPNVLEVKGCIAFFCQTQIWKRTK